MEVSWKRINDDTRNIIQEFERLYTYDSNFTECERLLTDIFSIYSSKYNIKLDENENFEHIFHQLLDGIKDVIDNYTPTELRDQVEAKKIDKFFNKMSDDIFKTAEIRGRLREIDPSNLEFKRALEQGIKDAKARQTEIKEQLSNLEDIHKEIFGTKIPDLKEVTTAEFDDLGHFNIIEQKLNEVKALQDAISTMTPGVDDSDIQVNKEEIAILEADIEEEKTRIRRTNLVDVARLNSISITDITASLNETRALRDELDAKSIIDFTELQNNLRNVYNKYPHIYALAGMDFSKMDPNTEEGRKAIMDAYGLFESIYDTFKMDWKIYEKEVDIYENQIRQIEEEEKFLQIETPTEEEVAKDIPESIKTKLQEDHEFYVQMVHAQMYGDKNYKQVYDYLLPLFKENIKSGNEFVLRNEDGSEILVNDGSGNMVPKTGRYTTVDYDAIQRDLDSLRNAKDNTFEDALKGVQKVLKENGVEFDIKNTEDLIKFLQLEEYKDKIERDSKITAGDKLALTEYKAYAAWQNARTPEEREAARQKINAEREEDSHYLETFHYTANDYKWLGEHHKTAGKIGETKVPLELHSKEKSIGQNLKVFAHNVYAYSRWQNPFKAKGFLGFVGTTALDAWNIVLTGPRTITGYTGRAIAKVKYSEDKDGNPYNGRKDAIRGARVAYYKEKGDGAFKARFKGWTDETIFRKGRRENIESEIKERQIEEIDKSNKAAYIAGAVVEAKTDLERQKAIIRKNREIRSRDVRIIAGTQEVQGDIIRDTKAADRKTLEQRAVQRVALEYADVDSSYVSNTGSRNPAKNQKRNTQFEKEKEQLTGKRTITEPVSLPPEKRWGRKKGAVVAADPIGNAIRSQEIKNTLTRYYAIEQAALLKGQSALIKWGIGKAKTRVLEEVDTGRPETVKVGEYWEDPGTYHEEVIGYQEGNTASNLDFGDLEYGSEAHFEHTCDSRFPTTGWIEDPTAGNIQAMALDFEIPSNLSAEEYQALAKLGYKVGDRINDSVADLATKNLCEATGRTYAKEYIQGMFNLTENSNIVDTISQYFPQNTSDAFEIILNSKSYAGDTGVEFLTESFSTSHGITNLMQTMNEWGTGWGNASVNELAREAAKKMVEIKGLVPDNPILVEDFIQKPIYELQWVTKDLSDEARQRLMKLANGVTAIGLADSARDLTRESKTRPESGRETYRDDR